MDDYPVLDAECNDRSAQIIQIDNGRHVAAVAICAIACGLCCAISWWAISEQRSIADRYRNDLLYTQDEYQKVRNHTIELEARTKVLADEVQELKRHVRR